MSQSTLQPIAIWSLGFSPNPFKIMIICEELGVPYDIKQVALSDVKKEPYTSLNPNGRVPTIEDPNTGITLWESGAIVEYLIDNYDINSALAYTKPENFKQYYQTRMWACFQISGQGPYFGQMSWFSYHHSEKLPSAIERYYNEIKRVTGVLDAHLGRSGSPYLVGDKCTYADLMFLPYIKTLGVLIVPDFDTSVYTNYSAWVNRMMERAAVKKVMSVMDEAFKTGP
ncbi:glutathione-s-transferase theta, gst [Xylariaceae sp. FL1651]|nr:glutathione-s-transferase theta, gst [Xylariaceae sp. FL1651]